MTAQQLISVEIADGLAHLRLANPEQGNVLDLPMIAAFDAAVLQVKQASARAVLISAEGRNFCVGGDLRGMAAADGSRRSAARHGGRLHAGLRRLDALGVPVVAAVNGSAAGAGLSLTLAWRSRHRRVRAAAT